MPFLIVLCLAMPNKSVADEGRELQFEASLDVVMLPEGWNFGEVAGLATNDQGHLFVFHRGQHPLLEFDTGGNFVREIGSGLFEKAHGLRIDRQGNLWTADIGAHLVLRFDSNGRVTQVLGKRGEASKGWFDRDYNDYFLNQPHDVGFDSHGNVYVVDRGNARIVKYNSEGQVLTTWGSEGSEPGQFNHAHAIAVDAQDRIYVADRENQRIQIFDTKGTFVDEWTHIGYPYGLTLTQDGTLWMTDARKERIVALTGEGKVLGWYGGIKGKGIGQFGSVHTIAVAPSGSLYVGEVFNWRLQRLDLEPWPTVTK